jgi:hypothetical protein
VTSEAGPSIDFQQEFSDLDVRQQHRRLIDELLCLLRYCRIERRDLQAGISNGGLWQLVRSGQIVDYFKLLLKPEEAIMQVLFAGGRDGKGQLAGRFEGGVAFKCALAEVIN